MVNEPHNSEVVQESSHLDSVLMPRPTTSPFVLAVGLALIGLGVATNLGFLWVGLPTLVAGLGLWIHELLPGQGHAHEPLVGADLRPAPVLGRPGEVEQLAEGMPGYRMRLPLRIHPISAGLRGGLIGGLVMPVPALVWGVISGHGLWFPVNLLAGMAIPGVGDMTTEELQRFHIGFIAVALLIHVVMSAIIGLIYGVLLPTLPTIPRALAWGGLLMPLLWTAFSFALLGLVNPTIQRGIAWPYFIGSQIIFGVVAAVGIERFAQRGPLLAGVMGGILGGLVMPFPALLWSVASRHGPWYPANLLAGMALPEVGQVEAAALNAFRAHWFAVGMAIHAAMSVAFGIMYAWVLPRLRPIPGPAAWGGLVMPLIWTGVSYGLMGIVNPPLQEKVSWPWFIVSQFVFGVTAALVVVRSETIAVPPAGAEPRPASGGLSA